MTPTKRPTASEIVELLSNNPRLISPCIDVPLASVQVERTDSLELIPSVRKPSGSVSQTNRPVLSFKRSLAGRDTKDYSFRDNTTNEANGGGHCSPYSPMSGYPNGMLNGSPPTVTNGHHHPLRLDVREPLLPNNSPTPPALRSSLRATSTSHHNNNNSSSYVPPGYILLDHTNSSGHRPVADMLDYVSTSISSL